MSKTDTHRLVLRLVGIMFCVALAVTVTTIGLLYEAAFEQQRARLKETARSEARIIEAITKFNATRNRAVDPGRVFEDTITQVTDAHERYKGFGETGEITLARREGDSIVFLLRHRHFDLDRPQAVPWNGVVAEPMRRALKGQSGTVIARDYRNVVVLAAYEPVVGLNSGIVAKVDLAEIRAPFLKAGATSIAGTTLIVLLGLILFRQVSAPIVERERVEHALRENEKFLSAILHSAADGIVTIDETGRIQSFNPAAEKIFGYGADEVTGKNVNFLMTDQDSESHNDHIRRYRETGKSKILGIGPRELVGRHKNGSTIPLEIAVNEMTLGDRRMFIGNVRDITRRKEIEQDAKHNSELLQASLASMAQGFTAYDAEHKLVAFNEQVNDIFGYPPGFLKTGMTHEEIIRFRVEQGYHGDGDRDQLVKKLVRRSLNPSERTLERQSIDGKTHIYHRRPIQGGGYVITFTDITKRKRDEEALRASQGQLTLAQAMAKMGSWDLDLENNQLTWSDEIYRMFEVRREDFGASYEAFLNFVHPDDRAAVDNAYRESLASKQPYQIEHRILLPDGRIKFVEERCQTWYDQAGKPLRSVGTVQDISDRKDTERILAEKSALLEATFNNMAQGVVVFDSNMRLVAFNPQFAEIIGLSADLIQLGMPREELLLHRAEKRALGSDTEKYIADRLESARNQESRSGRAKSLNGREFFYERTPMPDGGLITTVMDITEQREAERQLQHAQKMEVVGQLTGGIAHDFNNILTAALGNLELATARLKGNGEVSGMLHEAIKAVLRGAKLAHRLLAFSRKQSLTPEVIDVRELVNNMAELIRRTLRENINIEIKDGEQLWMCEIDPSQLENAILNLAINAQDAMPGGGTLTIETANASLKKDQGTEQPQDESSDYVLIAVTDTGTGMQKEVVERAFEPFFTTKEKGKGSGLGLSMVYGFIRQSNGQVTINSEAGVGTTIKLYLPRATKKAEFPPQADRCDDVPKGRGEIVLVVEDDPSVRASLTELLHDLGYETLETGDSASALELLETSPGVSLLLTDVVLPGGMYGPELAGEIMRRQPEIGVLYMSGYPADLVPRDQFNEGFELVNKPFRRMDLAQKIRGALKNSPV